MAARGSSSSSSSSPRPYQFIVFGASGFTGRFVVQEVARSSAEAPGGTLRWAVAGRSRDKLQDVLQDTAEQLGTVRTYSSAFSY
ncbi:saccharopine dehydrogenase a, tandem duplicate 1 [Tachysurus ichikawai]